MTDEEAIREFHVMWDAFPGMARLIDSKHTVLAANPFAEARGFTHGAVCAKVGDPAIHKGCGLRRMLASGKPVYDRIMPDRIRGWQPVDGHDDLCVHFAVFIPEEGEQIEFAG